MFAKLRGPLARKLAKRLSRCLVLNDAGYRLSTVNCARYPGTVERRVLSNSLSGGPQRRINRGGLCDTKMLRARLAARIRALPTLVTMPMHCRLAAAVRQP